MTLKPEYFYQIGILLITKQQTIRADTCLGKTEFSSYCLQIICVSRVKTLYAAPQFQGNQGLKGILWVVDLIMLYNHTAGMISKRIHKQLHILCGSENTSILENLDLQGRSSKNGNITSLSRSEGDQRYWSACYNSGWIY